MPRATNPAYILAHPADNAGCGYHRIIRPVQVLAQNGYISGRADPVLASPERLKLIKPDVVVYQRQVGDGQIEGVRRAREALPDAFLVYELDDAMSEVPPWSPHHPYIPFDINERIAKAVSYCDAVTVTTDALAEHMRSYCAPGTDIRVVPNMLGKDDIARCDEIRNMKPPGRGKPRIGWCGGHAHKADLDLLIPAMRELHNRVEFVFMGQKPECEVPVEFHMASPPDQYLAYLAGLGLDLMLAPLAECEFNRCKSNLRILEAAALGCPVIATPFGPYLTNNPPVFYAENEQGWIDHLTAFLDDRDRFFARGEALKSWLQKRYLYENHLDQRLRQWLPVTAIPFQPRKRPPAPMAVVVREDGFHPKDSAYRSYTSLRDAVANSTCNIIYVRNGTAVTDEQLGRLLNRLQQGGVGSVIPLSNDGGVASFPQLATFTPVDAGEFGVIDKMCKSMFGPVRMPVSNPAGPVVALSRQALEMCGFPELDGDDIEASLVEWGVCAAAKGFENIAVADTYVITTQPHVFRNAVEIHQRCQLRWPIKEVPADPFAEVRRDLELDFHREHYKHPLPSGNASYAEWAAMFNELGDADLAWMQENFPPVKVEHFTYPCDDAKLTEAVRDRGIEWAVFTAADTQLAKHALYVFAEAVQQNPDADLFYADHDYIQQNGTCDRSDLKPARVDLHQLLQRDYLTQVFAVNLRALLVRIQYPESAPGMLTEVNLYGAALDMIADQSAGSARHVPRVLAHLAPPNPAQYITGVNGKIAEVNRRFSGMGVKVSTHPRFPFFGELSYSGAVPEAPPKVSIIIPTSGHVETVSPCLNSLLANTDYPNFEVIVIKSGGHDDKFNAYIQSVLVRDTRLRWTRYEKPFNWAAVNNWAAERCDGELLLFLNDDTRVQDTGWLKEMVGALAMPQVGAVGARLLYPNGFVQHCGVVCRDGLAGHLLKGVPEHVPGYNGLSVLSHEATAVTGACLLVRRETYEAVGRFDEKFSHNFNDVDFCLKLNDLGLVNVVVAKTNLTHLEGVSRPSGLDPVGRKLITDEGTIMQERYKGVPDRYWNPNLHFVHSEGGVFVSGLNCDQMQWPPAPWPHRGENWPQETVVLIGDDGSGWVEESRKGNRLYFLALHGYLMQFARPALVNVQAFDIREPSVPRQILVALGVTKILVRSILGSNAELLPFLSSLGIPIEYRPLTAEASCPRLDFKAPPDENAQPEPCGEGWRRGVCQGCIAKHNSPFGAVSIAGWRDQWRRFLGNVEFSESATGEIMHATIGVYAGVGQVPHDFANAAE